MVSHILDLLVNLAMLVALSNISGFIRQRWEKGGLGTILQGLLFGASAVLGMLRPLVLSPGLIFDGRSVVLSLCALFFGPVAGAIAAGMALASRILLGGSGTLMGVLVILSSALLGLLFRRRAHPGLGTFLGLGIAVHVTMVLLMTTVPGTSSGTLMLEVGIPVLLTYPLVTLLIGKILVGHARSLEMLEALRESEERHRSLLHATPDGIAIADMKGRVRLASPASARMFGLGSSEELVGRTVTDLLVEEDRARAWNNLTLLSQGIVTGPAEYVGLRADGSRVELEANAEFIRGGDGQPSGMVLVVRDITSRKRAEEELRTFQEAMDEFIRHSPIHVYIKEVTPTESRVLMASDNFQDMIGVPGRDMIGRTMAELFPAAFAAKMAADDWEVVSSGRILRLDEDLNGRSYTTIKFPIRARDRALLAGYTIDLTERKRAERELAEEELRLRTLVNSIPDLVWLKDAHGVFLFCNPMFERVLGRSEAEIVGKTDYDLLDAAQADFFRRNDLRAMAEGRAIRNEERLEIAGTAQTIILETTKTPMYDMEGRFIGVLGVGHDITERKRMEEEHRQLEAQLQQAQKMESVGSLAGGVAHDMNNVLAAIMALASAGLEAEPAGSSARRAFETILKASVRGGKMVRSLLDFARPSLSEERDLDLNAILRDEISLLERTTLARIHLQLDLAPELPNIRGDAGALTHALMNLCVNALDAMPEGGTLTLSSRRCEDGWVEVQVEDTGCGMPREILAKATDPFFSTKPQGKGTGLGLSLVYSTVKAHGGHLDLQSEEGKGTRVTLRFPSSGSSDGDASDAADDIPAPPAPRALSVLLVDDDDLIRASFVSILEILGHSPRAVASGEEALAGLAEGWQPDVVILDMNMPCLGGAETLPRLRALRPQLPVLLATGRADQTAQDLVAAFPGVTLLPKPFGMGDLRRHLGMLAPTLSPEP